MPGDEAMSTSYRTADPLTLDEFVREVGKIGWEVVPPKGEMEVEIEGTHISDGRYHAWLYKAESKDGSPYVEMEVFSSLMNNVYDVVVFMEMVSEHEDEYWDIYPDLDEEDDDA
jgi:hypothetical protein